MMKSYLLVLTICALASTTLAADHPIEGDRFRLRDPSTPSRRSVRFRAVRESAIDHTMAADPRVVGATLEVTGRGSSDGSSGIVPLDAGLWRGLGTPAGSKGYKWYNRARPGGIKRVVFRRRGSGGQLVFSGGGANWDYAIGQSQMGPIDVRFSLGSDIYCASATTFVRNQAGSVVARLTPPPIDCSTSVCANGILEGTEECDDDNTNAGDGCSPTCQLESVNPAVCAGISSASGALLDTVRIASGLEAPVHLSAPRLDPRRVFVVEQPGRIRLIKDGVLLATPFLAIEGAVLYSGEQGLLSVAFHPDYESNGQFFVYYDNNAGDLVIARYLVSGNPDLADAGSESILITIPHPTFGNHNGGNLNFGPDGFLYAATGDGGSGGDPSDNAQNDASRLGKLLRIDPSTGVTTNWGKGLRNPFRFSFDRANGDIYIGDVGQGHWEEIDYVPANPLGVNYGWDDMEGRHCFEPASGCLTAGRTLPVLEYCNSAFADSACGAFQPEKGQAVTGGFVYRGCRMPDLRGRYFYSDFYTAFIRSFMGVSGGNAQDIQNHTTDLDPPGAVSIGHPSSFGEDTRGELYIVDYDGDVFRIVPGS